MNYRVHINAKVEQYIGIETGGKPQGGSEWDLTLNLFISRL